MTAAPERPVLLPSNQPANRFYAGGSKIRAFRHEEGSIDHVPEDWVASTTTIFGETDIGLTELPTGERLRDAVLSDPVGWLGRDHHAQFGADTKLLVKLLDAGQRLPVHIHPSHEFAQANLGAGHGKAEAWYVVDGGTVHLGFARDVSATELNGWVQAQDVDALLGSMHLLNVHAGDTIYVPPGLPHAIGAGVFIVEVQEPEDMSVLLEWQDFAIDGPRHGHLGIGAEKALEATDRHGWSLAELETLLVHAGTGVHTLAAQSASYFRAEHRSVAGEAVLDAGFSILVILSGSGRLTTANGSNTILAQGLTILTPHTVGDLTITGDLTLLRCRPPMPDQAQ